jgi:hypothetical protein
MQAMIMVFGVVLRMLLRKIAKAVMNRINSILVLTMALTMVCLAYMFYDDNSNTRTSVDDSYVPKSKRSKWMRMTKETMSNIWKIKSLSLDPCKNWSFRTIALENVLNHIDQLNKVSRGKVVAPNRSCTCRWSATGLARERARLATVSLLLGSRNPLTRVPRSS